MRGALLRRLEPGSERVDLDRETGRGGRGQATGSGDRPRAPRSGRFRVSARRPPAVCWSARARAPGSGARRQPQPAGSRCRPVAASRSRPPLSRGRERTRTKREAPEAGGSASGTSHWKRKSTPGTSRLLVASTRTATSSPILASSSSSSCSAFSGPRPRRPPKQLSLTAADCC